MKSLVVEKEMTTWLEVRGVMRGGVRIGSAEIRVSWERENLFKVRGRILTAKMRPMRGRATLAVFFEGDF